ncbi:papilin [Nephila pilipes]|uniref:Papilin n=1 Tax=Nephila pilipes TaxID=299642 RepID=A0A8X6QH91_NEPPI|nr:papilin [Nephila pilipes]
MKFFVFLTLVAGAFALRECPENSHYESCGTACPLTCDNYQNPPKFCVLMCNPGCHCDPGYVKTEDGSCVLPEECPSKAQEQVCGENEHFNECGTDCPLTCDNYEDAPLVCNFMCRIGCECKKGFVKNSNGKCVRPEQCPQRAVQVCGENERFNGCGTACPLTCENYDNPPKFCNLMCKIGCECEEGYVRRQDGRCVKPEQCYERAEKNCQDKPESGMCMAYFPMWYYDTESQTCKKFIYGGCQGNGNRYASKEECLKQCGDASQSSSDVCDLPRKRGRCFGNLIRYYFDKKTNQCKEFSYSGCAGNENNFETLAKCENTCGETPAAALDRPDCDKAPETGVCRAYIPRYYYDQIAGMCKTFIYGGCGGNRNNFETEDECYNKCGALASVSESACDQEKKVGPCRAAFGRYFFNKQSGQCEHFTYGGCGGNDNNFLSQEDCEAVCVR